VTREALPEPQQKTRRGEIRLVAYKPLFSGAAVDRVSELQFQRPQAELELSADDARKRRIATGDLVTVGSNGSAILLPARVNRHLRAGIARVAIEHAEGLAGVVEVTKAEEVVGA
jgi:predicted molibdopterin-dependent oxidoreductase YjgC